MLCVRDRAAARDVKRLGASAAAAIHTMRFAPTDHPRHPSRAYDETRRVETSEIQRARVLSAMVEVATERGAANATVARVVARSGVSRRTFYELFSDREDCFLAAFDDGIARIANEVVPAYEAASPWQAMIRAGLTALLQFLDYDPGTGRLVVVETLGAGPKALERRRRVLAQIIAIVDEGRTLTGIPKGHTPHRTPQGTGGGEAAGREAKQGDGPPPLTAEGVVGGVLSLIHSRLLEGRDGSLVGLVNPLMSMIVLPYLGSAAARRELARPVPKASARPRPANGDPLRELPMRLTYRTVRVLMAVAVHPGSSNRAVGDEAGIADQGQISKLLARLKRLGLVENSRDGQANGLANVWTLTERGREVYGAIAQ
jgi:AcrR family transcriptional regulator